MSTYTPIASTKITSGGVSTVTFANIPQTYTDLVVIVRPAQGTQGECDMWIRVGGGSIDTGSNYSGTYLDADGANATTRRETSQTRWRAEYNGYPDTSVGNTTNIIQFINYSNKTTYKNALIRSNSPATGLDAIVQLWRSTSAIDTISFNQSTNTFVDSNFLVGTTFDIYGIDAQGSAQAKATGGHTIIRDSNYWYHVFNSSGTFTPTQALTADYLVVAGGGGGGSKGGGGGAGGLRCTVTASGGTPGTPESALSLTPGTAYTVTVGAGGVSGLFLTWGWGSTGGNGTNSVFSTITSTGGGGGGTDSQSVKNGKAGGSGGGAAGGGYSPSGTGGTFTANQGYAGAGNTGSAPYNGGGGGGAGAAGTGGSSAGGAVGGIGVQTSISGTATYYAGGGGGGWDSVNGGSGANNAGGSGGGGTGTSAAGVAGTANTGGGGGGGGFNPSYGLGGAGGSGIVIIRYPV